MVLFDLLKKTYKKYFMVVFNNLGLFIYKVYKLC